MKNIISFSLFLLLFSINSSILNAQSFSIEKNITYLGSDETVKHLPVFTYEIKNIYKDTLYVIKKLFFTLLPTIQILTNNLVNVSTKLHTVPTTQTIKNKS